MPIRLCTLALLSLILLFLSCRKSETVVGPSSGPVVTGVGAVGLPISNLVLMATVTPNGHDVTAFFEFGRDAAYGSTTPVRTIGSKPTPFLLRDTVDFVPGSDSVYHFRLVLLEAGARREGDDHSFRLDTLSIKEYLWLQALSIQGSKVVMAMDVNPDGSNVSCSIEYGLTTSYGMTTAVRDFGRGTTTMHAEDTLSLNQDGLLFHYRAVMDVEGIRNTTEDRTFVTGSYPMMTDFQARMDRSTWPSRFVVSAGLYYTPFKTWCSYEYGLTTAYGISSGVMGVYGSINGYTVSIEPWMKDSGKTYHYRWVARNVNGVWRSDDMTFTAP
jgi:hypothetical protein